MELSANVSTLHPSATIAVASRVRQMIADGADVIDLCVGEPDFPTPAFAAEGAIRAIREGRTRYTPVPGIAALREAIAAELRESAARPRDVDPAGVVVTTGAKQALFNLCFTLFGPGDRVVVPVPYWTSYPELVRLARAEPVFVAGEAENGYKVTPAALDRACRGRVSGLLLNSPSNPTGAVYSHEELEALARWAADRGAWLVSDEIYRRICFRGRIAPGVLDLPDPLLERVALVDGASKAFAMTGWRVGFSYTAPALAEKLSALQSQITSNTSTPAQYAALAAYSAGPEERRVMERMRATFQARRDLLVALFDEHLPGVRYLRPEGAFYLWIHADGLAREGEGSIALCERLLRERGVGLVPGAAFGDDAFVRLSFAYSEETLRAAVGRLAAAARPSASG